MTGAQGVNCSAAEVIRVNINPKTENIRYDYSHSSTTLANKGSDTTSPYAPDADVSTGGLREDHPVTALRISWQSMTYPHLGVACLSFDEITLDIKLSPVIYVAREYKNKPRCKNRILEHEHKHVKVDRAVVNKYAPLMGQAIKKAVDSLGILGPYKTEDLPAVREKLNTYIQNAATSYNTQMEAEMLHRQSEVDSLKEYEAVSAVCNH